MTVDAESNQIVCFGNLSGVAARERAAVTIYAWGFIPRECAENHGRSRRYQKEDYRGRSEGRHLIIGLCSPQLWTAAMAPRRRGVQGGLHAAWCRPLLEQGVHVAAVDGSVRRREVSPCAFPGEEAPPRGENR